MGELTLLDRARAPLAAGWREVSLGDLVRIEHGWPFKSEFFTEGTTGPIVVAIGNFRYTGGFRFESSAIKRYSGTYPPQFELEPGNILLVMTCQTSGGEILGIPARVPSDGNLYLHNQRMGRIVPRPGADVDLGFLYWLFLTAEFNRYLAAGASGTKIVHTSPSRIESFRFRLPSSGLQRAIARILGALDDKIELNRRTNETLEAMARAIFQSWFVDFDPVRAKMEGRQPVGMDAETAKVFPSAMASNGVPDGWQLRPLYECAEWINGAAYRGFEFCEPDLGLPIVKIAELKAGITSQTRFASSNPGEKYRIDTGDVLFSWSGNPDTSIDTFIWSRGPAWLNQHIFKVIPADRGQRAFVVSLLRHLKPTFADIARNKQTTGLGHVTAADMRRLLVAWPDSKVLYAADRILAPILERCDHFALNTIALEEARDTLLPKLLSGELRVPDAERAVADAL